VEWKWSEMCGADEDGDADADLPIFPIVFSCFDFSIMNAGARLLLLKTGRSLLECLRAYPLASFESKSSVFWRIKMRRLQLSLSTVAWTAGRYCCLQ
jgi:hypothetical protein